MSGLPLTVLLILGALSAFGPMSIDMYLPAFPALTGALHTSPGMVAYTLSAFFVGLSVGQLIYGPLADRFGRKPPLVAGVVIYALASIGCAFAPSITALIALRVAQALGGCAGMVIGRAMVRDRCEPAMAARIFSVLMLVMGLAPILAPMLGGWVLGVAGWRAIFWVLAGFGALCLLGVTAGLPETLPPAQRHSLSLGEIGRVYGGLLTQRRFLGYALAGGCCSAGMFAYIAGSPFVFITLHHVPETQYGYYFGANAAGLIACSQINAKLVATGRMHTLLGRAIATAATAGLALAAAAFTGWGGFAGLLAPLFAYVAVLGFVGPNATALALGTQRTHHGQASAMLGTLQFAVATASGALVGTLQNGTALPMAAVIAGCGLAGLVAYGVASRESAA